MVNESPSQTRAKRVENLIGARLASFRRAPDEIPVILAEASPTSREGVAGSDRHQVSSGENLSAIASRYGVSLTDIIEANPRIQPNRIVAGQWIEIPQRGGASRE